MQKLINLEEEIKKECEKCEFIADGSGVYPDRCSRYNSKDCCPKTAALFREYQIKAFHYIDKAEKVYKLQAITSLHGRHRRSSQD